ncbi:ribosomal protein S12p Asp88 (E. coli) methylthiotransferase [Porphyromonas crevioricanis JCM 15906]|uniref:Ribosomal protein uS12 methylthiotransferase RimO n=2 Tax=Porphyromonas crevioricanis TaxID=393921 RepID=A0AB34PJX2_9PORP|nr:30S ribosomal protein S12 methylthiotransferase RimO [Porphyromonas crevioricanis]KGN94880.1 ribosomal protein S12 methylthiotransferase [Porphyromonas crevioricanis]GAD04979.1 ribosomal protein S12p Asp88 (E. coli) methylthiotransferase [Porphyromonas crevioricanis JCM 15906]SJZ80869.1 ribosomal protein S12 methylthiotransferase [Porphyromonas crevioricanis]
MKRNKVDVITLGCSKNLIDSERLMRQFALNGYRVSHDTAQPDGEIVVINTCGFIDAAKEESIETILTVLDLKKRGRVGAVYVMGCLSERYRDELGQELDGVDRWYGKFDWPQLLRDIGKAYYDREATTRMLTTPSHYAYLKIAEGCDRSCSYCIIPKITGRYRSRPMQEILQEAERLSLAGVKELQLIAQDLTYYGMDLDGHRALLPELLRQLVCIDEIEWIRLHYAYPHHFPYELLDVIREEPKICNYLDIALQHISDRMLKQMRRNISSADTYNLLRKIRAEVPGIHLRTTLMVGHPGETEEDFQELLQFVRDIRFERMGAFIYSHEEGTWCDQHYQDDVPNEVKIDRLDRLMALQEEISLSIQRSKIDTSLKVIVDRKEDGYAVGRSQYDSPDVDPEVWITEYPGKNLEIGQFVTVSVTDATAFELYAEPIE